MLLLCDSTLAIDDLLKRDYLYPSIMHELLEFADLINLARMLAQLLSEFPLNLVPYIELNRYLGSLKFLNEIEVELGLNK